MDQLFFNKGSCIVLQKESYVNPIFSVNLMLVHKENFFYDRLISKREEIGKKKMKFCIKSHFSHFLLKNLFKRFIVFFAIFAYGTSA